MVFQNWPLEGEAGLWRGAGGRWLAGRLVRVRPGCGANLLGRTRGPSKSYSRQAEFFGTQSSPKAAQIPNFKFGTHPLNPRHSRPRAPAKGQPPPSRILQERSSADADFINLALAPKRFYKGSPRGLLKGYSRQAEFFAKAYRPEAAKRRLYKFGIGPKRFIAEGRSSWLGGYRFRLGPLVEPLENCLGPKPNLESRCLA